MGAFTSKLPPTKMDRIPDVVDLSIEDVRKGLRDGRFSCRELVQVRSRDFYQLYLLSTNSFLRTYCARIEQVNDRYHAVIQLNPDVMAIAAGCDKAYREGTANGSVSIMIWNVEIYVHC